MLWLIQPKEDEADPDGFLRYLEGTFEWIGQACAATVAIPLSVTLINGPVSWQGLPHAYETIRRLQHVRIGDGAHMVQCVPLPDPVPDAGGESVRRRSFLEEAELLDIHLESGRREEFFGVLSGLAERLGNEPPPGLAMEGYYAVLLVLLSHGNRLAATLKNGDVHFPRLMGFDDHPSWPAGYAYLQQTAEMLFALRQTGERKRAEQAVDRIRAHIEANLHDDLSLVRLAELVHFNPSYLSRMFKQACGVNLSEHIDECRVRKAKELLRQHELKIGEVGVKVGYDSPHSFIRFFKKMTGMTPQEYRGGMD